MAERSAAIRLLAFDESPEALGLLIDLVAGGRPATLRTAALSALAHLEGPSDLPNRLLESWPKLDLAGRVELAQFLTRKPTWALQLLWAIEKGEVSAIDIGTPVVRLLQESKFRQVATEAQHILPPLSTATREQVIQEFLPALNRPGDKARGHEIYTQRCATCHRFRGEGNAFGPDLESVVSGGKEKILTHLIDPNREVAPQFAAYTVELKDGTSLAGIVGGETPAEVIVREPLGKETALRRDQVARLQTTGRSPMPEGLEAGLSLAEVAGFAGVLVGGSSAMGGTGVLPGSHDANLAI